MFNKDTVFTKDIACTAITGKDAWNRPTPQPITISLNFNTDFHKASKLDNLKYSINYAVITRNVTEFMKSNEHLNFKSLGNIAQAVSDIGLDESRGGGSSVEVTIKSTKSEIRADSVEYKILRNNLGSTPPLDVFRVDKLRLLTIIGVFTFERLQKQIVDIDLEFKIKDNSNLYFHKIIEDIVSYVESSNFKTVEALVSKIGQLTFQKYGAGIEEVLAVVTKPNAFSHVEGVGVSSTVTEENFKDMEPIELDNGAQTITSFNLPVEQEKTNKYEGYHTAFVAFGSNSGDQILNINDALRLLQGYGITVESTSSLYISKPMYYLDQPDFFNGVIKVNFQNISPHRLLEILKEIEYSHLKRVKEFDNGPRSIDLDIILYDDVTLNTDDLIIPHKALLERTFVLQPLCEILPPDFIHPISAESIHSHLKQLLKDKPQEDESIQVSSDLLQFIPVPRLSLTPGDNILRFDHINKKSPTLVMAILNMTPDSFSDAGRYYEQALENIVKEAERLVDEGANIIDIGGVSTRPGSTEPTEEEELQRVVPLVKAIRESKNPALKNILISIDTYRSNVAEESLIAGADIINDISMGKYDDMMFDVIALYGCPYIMNHTRGTPKTMSKLTNYESNTNDDLVEYVTDPKLGQLGELNVSTDTKNLLNGVSRELSLQMFKAMAKGVKKWQLIIDPGVGFAKNLQQNLDIIRHASFFKKYSLQVNERDGEEVRHKYLSFNGLPVLVGTSRKKFLGTLTGKETTPKDRVLATAATVTASIEQNTDIVRVHDVKEMKDVVLTSDAIYRSI
ncbi:Folic acid synthesis protein FOL1 [Candida viswanathii]|uniref:Folic acid synthesis protein fol1 n=1 Tax=Candida viswanathii TaxID=5486 RepID=A0A367YHI1_9ASCO|nr:Folic acid synthesis protein FOL1 [Candida viswanathii]